MSLCCFFRIRCSTFVYRTRMRTRKSDWRMGKKRYQSKIFTDPILMSIILDETAKLKRNIEHPARTALTRSILHKSNLCRTKRTKTNNENVSAQQKDDDGDE